jgi:hypothetical protein
MTTPCSPTTGWPVSSNASTEAPRYRHEILPASTGTIGQPPTKAEQMSVPPLIDDNMACSATQS